MFAFLTVITQKAPEHGDPVLHWPWQSRAGQLLLRFPAEHFVLLCSLAVKGAVQKCLRLLMALVQLVCSCVLQVQDLVSTGQHNLLYPTFGSGVFPSASS